MEVWEKEEIRARRRLFTLQHLQHHHHDLQRLQHQQHDALNDFIFLSSPTFVCSVATTPRDAHPVDAYHAPYPAADHLPYATPVRKHEDANSSSTLSFSNILSRSSTVEEHDTLNSPSTLSFSDTSPVDKHDYTLNSPSTLSFTDTSPVDKHDTLYFPFTDTSPVDKHDNNPNSPSTLSFTHTSPRSSLRRSLTHPNEDAMNFVHDATSHPMPSSPPDLSISSSKSSKSSSFRSRSSYSSTGTTDILTDVAHFEDIGLDDEIRDDVGEICLKSPNPFTATYDLRSKPKRERPGRSSSTNAITSRELTSTKMRPAYPSLHGQVKNATEGQGLGLLPLPAMSRRGFTSPSTPTLAIISGNRNRSPSPASAGAHSLPSRFQPRRGGWQARERKSQADLEKECEEDDGDDVPDDFVLENIPISPRPPEERVRPLSLPGSPNRLTEKKEKIKPAGNGTPLVPVEQGSLRSPSSPAKPIPQRGISMGQFPIHHDIFHGKGRAKSWTAALSDLSEETKSLTEKLEEHADTQEAAPHNPSKPRSRSSSRPTEKEEVKKPKLRVQSSLAELPPLRRTNIMIDPLPCSKEKEAVLSRTRPSWLPPKNPAEEKRHLKEYQRMMAQSLAAEKRKEIEMKERKEYRDDTAGSLGRIWEEHVLPNWNHVVGMKRTRELWWRGIAPRSRGTVWQKAIGNELELGDASYHAALGRAKELEKKLQRREGSEEEKRMGKWFAEIRRDVERTYPELRIFQRGGPLHEALIDVLAAYAMYRSDAGYVSGTNTITALLLLNLPTPANTFCTLANALNRPLPLSFLTRDMGGIRRIHSLTLSTLADKLPVLYNHLCGDAIRVNLDPGRFLDPMFEGLFTSTVGLDEATRLWDVWAFEGDAVLVRAAVAMFAGLESRLYGAESAEEVQQVLLMMGASGQDDVKNAKGAKEREDEWMQRVRDAGRSGAVTPRSGDE